MATTVKEAMDTAEAIIARIMDANDIQLLIKALKEMEVMKYALSRHLAIKEANRYEKRKEAMLEVVLNPDLKKISNSSTLTNAYIDGKLGVVEAEYNSIVQMLRNIRSSLDSIRTLISTEKSLIELAR